jgi:hypothetical protein
MHNAVAPRAFPVKHAGERQVGGLVNVRQGVWGWSVLRVYFLWVHAFCGFYARRVTRSWSA